MGPRTLPQPQQHDANGRRLNLPRLGFAVALGAEARALGTLHSDWMLEISGIGPDAAVTAARKLVERGCEAIISWGIAGGLSPGLTIGDLVVPEQIRGDDVLYAVDANLRRALAARLGNRLHGGALVTTAEVIRTPQSKAALHRRHGAIAVDMESAAIAQVAADHRLPFAAIRAISDRASDPLPRGLAAVIDANTGRLRPRGVAKLVLTGPHLVPRLLRTGRDFATALSALSAAAGVMKDSTLE